MLINLSNHPKAQWTEAQLSTAIFLWDEVEDRPFPNINPSWSEEEVAQCGKEIIRQIMVFHPDAVLCQGEMTMLVYLVSHLEKAGIPVYAATTERKSSSYIDDQGVIQKQSEFRFVRFRRYLF